MYGSPADAQVAQGQSAYAQPAYAQPPYGQPPYGQPAYGQSPYGQPQYGQPAYGQPAYGQPAYGQPAYGQPAPGLPGYGEYPVYAAPNAWAVPSKPKRRTGVIVASIVAVLVVLCGGLVAVGYALRSGSSSGTPSAAGTPTNNVTTPAADPTPSAVPSSTAPSIPDGNGPDLKAHLVAKPAGAETVAVTGSSNGVFSIDQFVKVDFNGNAAAKSLLQGEGFEIGAEERWILKGVETHIQLLQFQDDEGALAYGAGQNRAFTNDSKYTNHALSGVADGYAYELKGLDAAHNHRAVLMAPVGPIFVVIFFYEPGPLDRTAELTLMKQQIAKVAA